MHQHLRAFGISGCKILHRHCDRCLPLAVGEDASAFVDGRDLRLVALKADLKERLQEGSLSVHYQLAAVDVIEVFHIVLVHIREQVPLPVLFIKEKDVAALQLRHIVGIAFPVYERTVFDVQKHVGFRIVVIGEDHADVFQVKVIGILEMELHVETVVRCGEKGIGLVVKLPAPLVLPAVVDGEDAVGLEYGGGIAGVREVLQADAHGHGALHLHFHDVVLQGMADILFGENDGVVPLQRKQG